MADYTTMNPEAEKFTLSFQHIATNQVVSFPAYLENLSDLYTSNWMAEDVYGRMDPIATFVNTRRAISVSWNVPAESYGQAKDNLRKINKLLSFLYPVYSAGSTGATAINQAPLMRVKFGNLICRPDGMGLLGYLNGFTFDPRIENGMFYQDSDLKDVGAEYYPKTVLLNCEMNVLHEHELGFKASTGGDKYVFRDKNISFVGRKTSRGGSGGSGVNKFPYIVSPGEGRTTRQRDSYRIVEGQDYSHLVANSNADPGAYGANGSAPQTDIGDEMPPGDDDE